MKCAIHQPNFFPWMPWFEKLLAADVFVFLTQCQWEKGGYQNRFKLHGEWYTMRVRHGLDRIIDKQYVDAKTDYVALMDKLARNDRIDLVHKLFRYAPYISNDLSGTNIRLVAHIIEDLGIPFDERPAVTHDDAVIDNPDVTGTQRLVDICKALGATEYISGPSGPKYMDMDLWEAEGIKVTVHQPQDTRHVLEVL